MDFVFVDETGDPGNPEISPGSSAHFGLALLHVRSEDYKQIRRLLTIQRWSFEIFTEMKLALRDRLFKNLMRGLKVLAEEDEVATSGLYILKNRYQGRYLSWAEDRISRDSWTMYLRNYLLRHLLEQHFSVHEAKSGQLDLILDRVDLSERQRSNVFDYLNSSPGTPLRERFKIPTIKYLTIADSEHVGGSQVAHSLAEIVSGFASERMSSELEQTVDFVSVACFLGRPKSYYSQG